MAITIPNYPHDKRIDVEAAVCEVAEVAAENAVAIDDLMKAVNDMVTIYIRMIHNGLMTIDDVPARWKEQVQELLESEVTDNANG